MLCGGVSALVKAGFDTLVDAGYQPEVAYFECMHELKLIVDLMYQGGLNYMRTRSATRRSTATTPADRASSPTRTRKEMRRMLTEIQNGTYAKNWIEEDGKGRPWFNATRKKEEEHRIEQVGEKLRSMMPFLKPVKHKQPAGV